MSLASLTTLWSGFTSGDVAPTVAPAPTRSGLVDGFPPEAFPNTITLYTFDEGTNPQGGPVIDPWESEGAEYPASVQPATPVMSDPQGRLVINTMYDVLTPTDIGAKARDKIGWGDKTLTAQGPTTDAGGMGVIWKTACTETR